MLGPLCEAAVFGMTIFCTFPRSDRNASSQSLHHDMSNRNLLEKQLGSASGSWPRVQINAARTAVVLQSISEVPLEPGNVRSSTRDLLSLDFFSGVAEEQLIVFVETRMTCGSW